MAAGSFAAVATSASFHLFLSSRPGIHRKPRPLPPSHLNISSSVQFDFHQSRRLCSHQKDKFDVLRTKVKLVDGEDDEACELVNGVELLIGEGGDSIRAYLCTAVKNNNGTGLLLLSDIFGFEDSSTRDFAYRLGCNGYNVLVPDLFRGEPWKEGHTAAELEQWLARQQPETVAKDIDSSTKWLIDEFTSAGISRKFGIVGFCFGGKCLIETLAKDENSYFGTAVCFYGTRMDPSLAHHINVPVLFISGDGDPFCQATLVLEMEKRIRGSKAVIYGGRGHGFAHRPESQEDDRDAEDAFNVSRSWLKDYLVFDEDKAAVSSQVV
ncbi:hypothetical protein KSP39_PZI006901 [Platanthera zijinensis]|uniref:Carboxymethylenebutenolidase homolog n=1 Tax=Platanthera zijinensis TaxID=2320716 RepID=A0AAP0BRJ9_9ASPA